MALKDYSDNKAVRSRGQDLVSSILGLFYVLFTRYDMYEHGVEHLLYRKQSIAQRNQPAQSRKASTCRSECDNASKQAE